MHPVVYQGVIHGKYFRFVTGLQKYLKGRLDPIDALDCARSVINQRIEQRKIIFQYSEKMCVWLLKESLSETS